MEELHISHSTSPMLCSYRRCFAKEASVSLTCENLNLNLKSLGHILSLSCNCLEIRDVQNFPNIIDTHATADAPVSSEGDGSRKGLLYS